MSIHPPEPAGESAASEPSNPIERLRAGIIVRLADLLNLDPRSIQVDEPLTSYGVDSMMAVELVGDLEAWLNLPIAEDTLHEHGTVRALAEHLAGLRTTAP